MASEDVAIIGIGVETSGVEKGKKSLESLAAAGGKAEASLDKIGATSSNASKGATALGGAAGKAAGEMDKLGRSTEAVAAAQQKAGQAFTESARGLSALGGALAGALSVSAFIKAADSATILNNQLKLATGSAQAAASAYEGLFQIAQRSRVSFAELGSTFAAISRAGSELGISQQRLLGITEAIGNAMTISGGSAQGMQAALTQLGQGLASGTLRGEELNSVMEQTPRLAKALADGLGVSIGQLRKLGEQGALTSEVVIQALQSQQAKLAEEVKNSATTVAQAFTQLQNSAVAAIGDLDKASGSTGALATGIQAVSTTIGDLRIAFAGVADSGANFQAFGDGVSATIRTIVLGAVTSVAALQNLGKAAAGLAAAGTQLATGGGLSGANAALQAASEDIAENTRRWQENADAILKSAGAGQRAADLNSNAMARIARQGGDAVKTTKPLDLSKLLTGGDKAKKQVDTWIESQRAAAKEWERTVASFQNIGRAANDDALGLTKAEAALKSYLESAAYLDDVAQGRENEVIAAAALALENERLAETTKAAAKAAEELSKADLARIEAADRSLKSVKEKLQSLSDEEAALTIAAEQNISLAQAIEEVEIARLREAQASLMQEGGRAAEVWAIQEEIEARKKLKDAIGSQEARRIAAKSAQDAADAWQKASEQIEKDITDALMRGFESGKGFAEVLRDTVVNMFKTLVLRPVIQATVQGGLSVAGFGGPGAASGGTSLMGLAAMGNYSAGASTYALRAGDWLATSSNNMFADFGTTLQANSQAIGQFTQVAGDVLGYANALNTAFSRNAQGGKDYGAAAGQAIGTYFGGPIGSAIGGKIGKALGIVDYGGTYHTGGIGSYSAAGGAKTGAAALAGGMTFGLDAKDYNAAGEKAAAGFAKGIVGVLDSTATMFGKTAGYQVSTAFADDISPDGAWGALFIKLGETTVIDWKNGTDKWPGREFADGDAGLAEYQAAVALDVRNLLIEQTPDWADAMLTALGDAPSIEQLAATVGQINAAASAIDSMGKASQSFAAMGEEAAGALIKALGGAEAAVAGLSGYYSSFYSEAERTKIATDEVTAALAKIGVAMPTTRDAFRSIVDAAIAAGDTDLAAKLISISGAFASVVPAAEAAATAVATTAATVAKAAEDAAEKAKSTAYSQLESSVERERALWEQQATAAASLRDEVQTVFDTLASSIQDLRSEALGASLGAAQGQAFITGAIASVRAGAGLPDSNALASAISSVRGGINSPGVYANSTEREFAALKLAGELSVLQEAAGEQLTVADRQLKAAEDQIEQLDQTLAYWRNLLDSTKDNIDATLSVADAVNALRTLMFPERGEAAAAAATVSGGVPVGTLGASFGAGTSGAAAGSSAAAAAAAVLDPNRIRHGTPYERSVLPDSALASFGAGLGWAQSDALGRHRTELEDTLISEAIRYRDMGALDNFSGYFEDHPAEYADVASVLRAAGIPGFARGGAHAGGWALVGEEGPELAYMPPAQIYTASQTSTLLGGGGRVEVLLQALIDRVAAIEIHAASSADANAQTADVLTRVAPGDSLTTSAAPAIA